MKTLRRKAAAPSGSLARVCSAPVARWLALLRVLGGVVQLSGIAYGTQVLHVAAPFLPLACAVGATGATTIALLRASSGRRGVSTLAIAVLLAQDTVSTNVVVWHFGGIDNPFAGLPAVYVAVAAALLPGFLVVGVLVTACVGYAALFVAHGPADVCLGWCLPPRFAAGSFLCFLLTTPFMAYCIRRIAVRLEKKRAALARLRKREAETARVTSLSSLAASAAHGLASPLTTIAVVAQDLEQHSASLLALPDKGDGSTRPLSRVREDALLIRREIERCRSVLQQMARQANDPGNEGAEETTPAEVVREAISPLLCRAEIEATVDASAQLVTLARRHHVEHTLRALVDNAVEAVADLPPERRRVRIHVAAQAQQVVFHVRDLGPGMPSAVRDQATRPGFSTKSATGSMGLGLFLAKGIVDKLGGRLTFHSMAGAGTTATLQLPALGRRRDKMGHPNEGTMCLVAFQRKTT